MMKLRSFCGQVSNKLEVNDKFVRMELANKKRQGETYDFAGKKYSDAFSSQYIYQAKLRDPKTNDIVEKGVFISKAEARLLERCEMDREMIMEFGNGQYTYTLLIRKSR